ncbi:hypothetical protein, partial [Nocardiopsis rhodophaea]
MLATITAPVIDADDIADAFHTALLDELSADLDVSLGDVVCTCGGLVYKLGTTPTITTALITKIEDARHDHHAENCEEPPASPW